MKKNTGYQNRNYLMEHFGISSFKRLTKEEEIDYFNKYARGSREAYEFLVTNNLSLVLSIVKKYHISKIEFDDLFQIGVLALINAINTFDIEKEYRFSTYATKAITSRLLHNLKLKYDFSIPANKCRELNVLARKVEELNDVYGRELTIFEIQDILNLSENEAIYLSMILNPHISIDSTNQDGLVIKNIIKSNDISVEDKVEDNFIYQNFLQCFDTLDDRIIKMIKMYFIDGKSYTEIGETFGISRQGVTDNIKRAFTNKSVRRKLKRLFQDNRFDSLNKISLKKDKHIKK